VTKSELLKAAQKSLAIQDVYLCDASVWANRTYEPGTPVSNSGAQFKLNPTNDCQIIGLQPPQNAIHYLVRYYVGTGLRLLAPGVEPQDSDITRDKLIAEIEATFVVRYVVLGSDKPTNPMLEAFNDNAVHHIWPYWREFLEATTIRLRVPPVVLPMREVAQASGAEPPPTESGTTR
jgi:hypothetical protein